MRRSLREPFHEWRLARKLVRQFAFGSYENGMLAGSLCQPRIGLQSGCSGLLSLLVGQLQKALLGLGIVRR